MKKDKLKALVYSPYWDTLGGGERYLLGVIKYFQSRNYAVHIPWPDENLKKRLVDRFGISTENIFIDTDAFEVISTGYKFDKWRCFRRFETTFWLSDGSIPILFSKKNYLHFQVPFADLRITIPDQIKLTRVSKIIFNSEFTKKVLVKNFDDKKCRVVYPPVTMFSPEKKKEKIILNVGRFGSPTHPKKQQVMVEAFSKLPADTRKGWKLVLAGGYMGEQEYIRKLRDKGKNIKLEIITNPRFKELQSLYAKSSIYWHAAGYEVDEKTNPEGVEHFGITTAEAMSAGCVPVVINKGGQREVVNSTCGYLWNTIPQLIKMTSELIKSPKKMAILSKRSMERASKFDDQHFMKRLDEVLR